MRAQHPRPCAVRRERAERVDERVLRRGDERRLVGGDARREQRLSSSLVVVGSGGQEVDAAEPVHLDVDEAGYGDAAPAETVAETDLDDHAVLDRDVTRDEL